MSGDASWASVSLLLHCDGSDGSTTFTDSGPDARTVSRTGTPTITTAQSKWGGASADIAGSGNYLTSAAGSQWDFGTGEFCIEMWVRSSSTSSFQCVASSNTWTTATGGDWALYTRHNSVQRVVFTYVNSSSSFIDINSSTINVHDGAWHHVAVTRSGTTVRLFVDGAQLGSATYSGQLGRSDKALTLGAHVGDSRSFTGNLDDIRITKGVARYSAAFTAPTEAFPDGPPPPDIYALGGSGLGVGAALAWHQFASAQGGSGLGSGQSLTWNQSIHAKGGSGLGVGAALVAQYNIQALGGSGLGVGAALAWHQFAHAQGGSGLGVGRAVVWHQYARASGGSGLGVGKAQMYMPPVIQARGGSGLGIGKALVFTDFTGAVSETATLRYVADLITPSGTVRVPVSSWQATLRTDTAADAANYLQCVVPAATESIDTIVAATELVISRTAVLTSGGTIEYEMARAPISVRNFAGGPRNYTATISGTTDALLSVADPPAVFDRALTGIRSVSDDNGSIRVRASIDWLLRPGMRAYYGSTEIVVDYINYYVPGNDQYMDVGESA